MRCGDWVAILALAALGAVSVATAEPLRLSMPEAVARATAANLEYGAGRKDVDVAQANLDRSKSWLPSNPFFSAGSQHTSNGVGPNYTFLLSQELEVAGQRGARVAVAEQGVAKAQADLHNAAQTLAANVRTAFVDVLIGNDRVTLEQQSVAAASQLADQASSRTPRSDSDRFDANSAHIQASRARRELAAAEQTRDAALGTLRRLLGLPLEQDLELVGAPIRTPKDLPPGPELVQRALDHRADLAALHHALGRADQQLQLSRRERIPNVTLSGTFSRFEGDTLTGGDIGVPLPLFRDKTADITEAAAERERSKLELQYLERSIAQEVIDARRTCATAGGDVDTLARDIIPRSEDNVDLEQQLFKQGSVSVTDLIGVQIDLLTARRDYLDAVQKYNEALIDLARVTADDSLMQ